MRQDLGPRLRREYAVMLGQLSEMGMSGCVTAPSFAGKFGIPEAVGSAARRRLTLHLGIRLLFRKYRCEPLCCTAGESRGAGALWDVKCHGRLWF